MRIHQKIPLWVKLMSITNCSKQKFGSKDEQLKKGNEQREKTEPHFQEHFKVVALSDQVAAVSIPTSHWHSSNYNHNYASLDVNRMITDCKHLKTTILHPCRQKKVHERGLCYGIVISCHSTCVLRPSEDGGDLIALCGFTLGPDSSCTHSHRALVGLDPAEVSRGGTSTVWHLRVSVVCLRVYRPLTCGQNWKSK